MGIKELTDSIKSEALALGFDLVGISPVGDLPENQFYKEWLSNGYAGEMGYMEKNPERRADVRAILPDARSVVSCGLNYNTGYPYSTQARDGGKGWIARYAWGDDYHETIKKKLEELKGYIHEAAREDDTGVCYVDTGPVLERNYARHAGVGWTGKNTCIINQQKGSWLFLGEIITTLELDYDTPPPDRCGTCTSCIDACPTDAIREPYVLDSRRCISYLTIELKGSIPMELRDKMDNNIFGCDICQDVCPWNKQALVTEQESFLPRESIYNPDLGSLSRLSAQDFRDMFKGSPVKRSKRRGFLRNVMIAIGNSGDKELIPRVKDCLEDEEPLVRMHAAWALWKLDGKKCEETLMNHRKNESDPEVLDEIDSILQELSASCAADMVSA